MTPLEQAQRDAAHFRDELQIATMLLARVRGQFEADTILGVLPALAETPSREALRHDINKFMRRTSLYPKQEA
jgi:sugar diacid utilization regulator